MMVSTMTIGIATAQCGVSAIDPFAPTAGATFHEGGGLDSDYTSSMTCWTKLSCPGQRVTLDIITFSTERDFDKLSLFEGTASGPTDAYVAEEAEGVTISCRLPQELHGDGDTDEVDINSDITSDGEYLWLRYLPPESVCSPPEPGF